MSRRADENLVILKCFSTWSKEHRHAIGVRRFFERRIGLARVWSRLMDLENDGFLTSEMGEPEPIDGPRHGHRKRLYTLTKAGEREIENVGL